MSSRAVFILDAVSVKSVETFNLWRWQFSTAITNYLSRPDRAPLSSQHSNSIHFRVHFNDKVRNSLCIDEEAFTWTHFLDALKTAEAAFSDFSEAALSSESTSSWKKRLKELLQGVLVGFDWEALDTDDNEDTPKKTSIIVVFTKTPDPSSASSRDSFSESSIVNKLKEYGIRIVICDLKSPDETDFVTPTFLHAFLKHTEGTFAAFGMKTASFPPLPVLESDRELESQEESFLDPEDYFSVMANALEPSFESEGTTASVQASILAFSVDLEKANVIPTTFKASRNLQKEECSGKALLSIGKLTSVRATDVNRLGDANRALKFQMPKNPTFLEKSIHLLCGEAGAWFFVFQEGEDAQITTGIAVPVYEKNVPSLLKMLISERSKSPVESVAEEETSQASGSANPMKNFMRSCIKHLSKKEVDKKKPRQPNKVAEKKFKSRYRPSAESSGRQTVIRRADAILQKSENVVLNRLSKYIEAKIRKPKSSKDVANNGGNTLESKWGDDLTLDRIVENANLLKKKHLGKATDEHLYKIVCKIVREFRRFMRKKCVDPANVDCSSYEAVKEYMFLTKAQVKEKYDSQEAESEDAKARKSREIKFQALLRLEVMATLVAKPNTAVLDQLGKDAQAFLFSLSSSAEGSREIRPFVIELLVAKYHRYHGKLLVDICGDFNLPIPKSLSEFQSPTSTDDDTLLDASSQHSSLSVVADDASRDSGPIGGSEGAGAFSIFSRAEKPSFHRRISMISLPSKSTKQKNTKESAGPSFLGRLPSVKSLDIESNSSNGSERARRNLFGTARGKPDPNYVRTMKNKRQYLDSFTSPKNEKSPPVKRMRKAFQSPPESGTRTSSSFASRTPGSLPKKPDRPRLGPDVPETPDSVYSPEGNRTPGVTLRSGKKLTTPGTPGTPDLFACDYDKGVEENNPLAVLESPCHRLNGASSPVIKNFWNVVNRRTPNSTSRTPGSGSNPRRPLIPVTPVPAEDTSNSGSMPPPTWTPNCPRTRSSGKSRGSSVKKIVIPPVDVDLLDDQTKFPFGSPSPTSVRITRAVVNKTPGSAGGSVKKHPAVKRLLCDPIVQK